MQGGGENNFDLYQWNQIAGAFPHSAPAPYLVGPAPPPGTSSSAPWATVGFLSNQARDRPRNFGCFQGPFANPNPTLLETQNNAPNVPPCQAGNNVTNSQIANIAQKTPCRKGNNVNGQKGTVKCSRCREQSHKCGFDDPAMPCKRCAKANITVCVKLSAEEYRRLNPQKPKNRLQKLLTSSSNPDPGVVNPSIPESVTLITVPDLFANEFESDAGNLGIYRSWWDTMKFGPRHFLRASGSGVYIQILNVEYFLPPSKSHVWAILLMMSRMPVKTNGMKFKRSTMEYFQGFCSEVEITKRERNDVDNISGFYVMIQDSFLHGGCITECSNYYRQFCGRFKLLKESAVKDDRKVVVEWMWQQIIEGGLLRVLRQMLRDSHQWPDNYYDQIRQVVEILDDSFWILLSDEELDNSYPESMDIIILSQKIQSLAICLQPYLDIYLFLTAFGSTVEISNTTQRAREGLLKISRMLCRAIKHLPIAAYIGDIYQRAIQMENNRSGVHQFFDAPEIRVQGLLSDHPTLQDTAIALTYCFAKLLIEIHKTEDQQNGTAWREMKRYARALCILCGRLPSEKSYQAPVRLLRQRSLFWAGIILTEPEDVAANAKILKNLETCFMLGGSSSGCGQSNGTAIMEKITALLEMPRSRSEIIEIMRTWQFFEVSVDLVPWSFGLSLVRFEGVPNNRRLAIIRS